MQEKTGSLVRENNRLHDAVQTYANTIAPAIDALISEFGLSSGVTLVAIAALEPRQKARLLERVLGFATSIAAEAGRRPFEDNLRAMGYETVSDAVADVPNLFAGVPAEQVATTLLMVDEALRLIDGLIDDATIFAIAEKVVEAKAKVAQIAPHLKRV